MHFLASALQPLPSGHGQRKIVHSAHWHCATILSSTARGPTALCRRWEEGLPCLGHGFLLLLSEAFLLLIQRHFCLGFGKLSFGIGLLLRLVCLLADQPVQGLGIGIRKGRLFRLFRLFSLFSLLRLFSFLIILNMFSMIS